MSKLTGVGVTGVGGNDCGSTTAARACAEPEATQGHNDDGDPKCQRGGGDRGREANPTELVVGVDGQRERVVRQHDHRAVFTEGAEPGQQHAGTDPGGGKGYGDPPEP